MRGGRGSRRETVDGTDLPPLRLRKGDPGQLGLSAALEKGSSPEGAAMPDTSVSGLLDDHCVAL
jgi:hypothetical protein